MRLLTTSHQDIRIVVEDKPPRGLVTGNNYSLKYEFYRRVDVFRIHPSIAVAIGAATRA